MSRFGFSCVYVFNFPICTVLPLWGCLGTLAQFYIITANKGSICLIPSLLFIYINAEIAGRVFLLQSSQLMLHELLGGIWLRAFCCGRREKL